MEDGPLLINRADNTPTPINDTEFSIGSNPFCDYVIEKMGISYIHCTINKKGDKWSLLNQSRNETRVNKELLRFDECKDLKSGDIIQLGNGSVQFIFENPKDVIEIKDGSYMSLITIELLKTALLTAINNLTLTPVEGNGQPPPPISLLTNQNEDRTLTTNTNQNQNINQSQSIDVTESELTCSICCELFIKAVTLNCSHTFCKVCIEEWKKNNALCPICRTRIESQTSTLVLDNLIDKVLI